jgi:hypothetical protein
MRRRGTKRSFARETATAETSHRGLRRPLTPHRGTAWVVVEHNAKTEKTPQTRRSGYPRPRRSLALAGREPRVCAQGRRMNSANSAETPETEGRDEPEGDDRSDRRAAAMASTSGPRDEERLVGQCVRPAGDGAHAQRDESVHSYAHSLRYRLKETVMDVLERIPPHVQTSMAGADQERYPVRSSSPARRPPSRISSPPCPRRRLRRAGAAARDSRSRAL